MLSDLDDDELKEVESILYSQIHYATTTNNQPEESSTPAPMNPMYFLRRRYYERTHNWKSLVTVPTNETNAPLPASDPLESVSTQNPLDLNVPLTAPANIPNQQQSSTENQEQRGTENQQPNSTTNMQHVPVLLSESNNEKVGKSRKKKNLAKKAALKAKTERIAKAANEDAELFRNLSLEERKSVFKYQKKQRYVERKRLRKLEKEQALVNQYNKGLDEFLIYDCSQSVNSQLYLPPLNQPAVPKEKVETITQQNNDEVVSIAGSEGSSCVAVDLPEELLVISDDNDDELLPKIPTPIPKIEENPDDIKIEQNNINNDEISNDDADDVIYVEQPPDIVIDLDPEVVTKESQPPTDSELMKPPDFETLSVCSVSSNNLNADLKANNSKTTPKKTKTATKEREELLNTPESNDFLDTTLDVNQENFNFTLHGTDFNTSKEASKSKTLADIMCGSESSCSASDISAPVKTPIFSEIDFDNTSKGLFSENNLKSFSDFITPKRASSSIQITPLLTPSREIFEQVQTKAVSSRCKSDSDSSSEDEYGVSKIASISKKLPDLSHFETIKTLKFDKNDNDESESSKKKKKKPVDIIEGLVAGPKEKKRKKGKGLDFGNNSSDEKDETKRKKKKGKKGSSLEGSDNELTPKKLPRKEDESESDRKQKRKKNKDDDVSQSATKKLKRKKRVYDEWIENDNADDAGCLEVDEDVLNSSGEQVNTTDKSKKINIISEQVLKLQYDFNKNKPKKGKKSNDKIEESDAEDTSEISKGKKLKTSWKSSELQGDNDEGEDEINDNADSISEVAKNRGKKVKKGRKFSDLQDDRNNEEADEITEETEAEVSSDRGKKVRKSKKLSEESKDVADDVTEGVIEEEISNKHPKRTRKSSDNKKNTTEKADETPAETNETIQQTVKIRRKSSENIQSTKETVDGNVETDFQEETIGSKSIETPNETGLHIEIDTINQQESLEFLQVPDLTGKESTISEPIEDGNLQNSDQNSFETLFLDESVVEVPAQNVNSKSTDCPEQKYSDISDAEDDTSIAKNVAEDDDDEKTELFTDIIDIDNSDSDVEFIDDKNEMDIIELDDSDSVPCDDDIPCEDPSVVEMCDLSSISSASDDNCCIDLGTAGKDIELLNLTTNANSNRPKRFSDYFARDMHEFYTQSYGDEKLSLQDIQRNMSNNPSKWKILERDRVHIRVGKEGGPKCRKCREIGHIAQFCRNKYEPPKCWLCGTRGHYEPRCPNKMCTQCGRKNFATTVFCSKCAFLRNRTCKLCKMVGHEKDKCPDIWRRYHLTIAEGPIVKSTETPLKLFNNLWCSGCAKNGHLEHECNYYGREHPPTAPYIVEYEELYGFPQENLNVNDDVNQLTDMQDIRVSFENNLCENEPLVVHNPKVPIDTNNRTRMVEAEQVESETIITECVLFTSVQADILKDRSGQMFLCGLADRFHLPLCLSKHPTMTLNCIHITASKGLGLKVKELIMEFLHGKSTIENKKLYFKLKHHLELLASIPLEQPSYLLKLICNTRNAKLDKYVRLNTILFGKYGLEEGRYQTQLLQDIFMKFDTSKKMSSQAAKMINNALSYVFLNVRPMNKYQKLVKISKNMVIETNNIDETNIPTNYTFLNSVESTPEYMSLLTALNTHTQIVCVRPYCTSKFIKDRICRNFIKILKEKMKVEILKQNIVLTGSKDEVEEGAWRLKIFINNLYLVDEFPHKAAAIYEKLVKSIASVNVWWYVENIHQLYGEICRHEDQHNKDDSPATCKLLGKMYTKLNAILFGKYCVSKGHKTMKKMKQWAQKLPKKQVLNDKNLRDIISGAYFYIFDFSKKDIDYKAFINELVVESSKWRTSAKNFQIQKKYINSNLKKYIAIATLHEDDIQIQELELLMSMMKKNNNNLSDIAKYVQDLKLRYK